MTARQTGQRVIHELRYAQACAIRVGDREWTSDGPRSLARRVMREMRAGGA